MKLKSLLLFLVLTTFSTFAQEEFVGQVSFALVEKAPVFPGCKGKTNRGGNLEIKKCLNKKLQGYFLKNLNTILVNNLGLKKGKHYIYTMFMITSKGKITDIQVRAPKTPSSVLKKEVLFLLNTLPKMEPAKQKGKVVEVKYTLPIRFEVEQENEFSQEKVNQYKKGLENRRKKIMKKWEDILKEQEKQ